MSAHRDTTSQNDGQSKLTDGLGEASLQFVYEKATGGDFNSIQVRFYVETKEGKLLWGSGEINLNEGDTVTLTDGGLMHDRCHKDMGNARPAMTVKVPNGQS